MKSCLNALSTLLAAICAFLLVVVASLTLVIFIGERLVFNPGTYKQALRSQHVYDRMPALIAEQIIFEEQHPSSGASLPSDLLRLTQDDWQVMLSDILTPASLKAQAESVIDQIFVYVNTPGMPLKLKVSLVDFKQKLGAEEGYRAVMHIIALQPACSSDEWAQIVNNASAAQFEDIPYCRPPDEVLAASDPYIRAAIHEVVAAIPNETTLNPNEGSTNSTAKTNDGRVSIQRVRRYILISLCLPAGLFLLIAVFGLRSFTSGGLWLGLPLMVTGLFIFVAAVVAWMLPTWLIARNTSGQVTMQGVAPGVTQMLVDVGTSLAHTAARTLGIVSIVLIVLGMGLVIAGFLFGWATRSGLD